MMIYFMILVKVFDAIIKLLHNILYFLCLSMIFTDVMKCMVGFVLQITVSCYTTHVLHLFVLPARVVIT